MFPCYLVQNPLTILVHVGTCFPGKCPPWWLMEVWCVLISLVMATYMTIWALVIFKVTGWSTDIAEQTVQDVSARKSSPAAHWHKLTYQNEQYGTFVPAGSWRRLSSRNRGGHTHRLSSHNCDCVVKPDQPSWAVWPLTTLIFRGLTIDRALIQPLTVDYMHICLWPSMEDCIVTPPLPCPPLESNPSLSEY